MSGSFDQRGRLEIGDGRLILCVGKKRSGKSVMGRLLFESYPDDRIVIDIAGDDGPSGGSIIDVHGTVDDLPLAWPESRRDDKSPRMTLRYHPDAGSKTYLDDIDAMIGLAVEHGDARRAAGGVGCCVLVHEIGVAAKANRARPNMDRVLMHNRHHAVTMIMCGPRPMNIDPLCLQQSDLVYVFEVPNKRDRVRLAEQIGWDTDDMDAACHALGPHEYLRFDANEDKPAEGERDLRLRHFEALPQDVYQAVMAAKG